MNLYLIALSLVGVVYGRPDVSHLNQGGYHIDRPYNAYLTPNVNYNQEGSVTNIGNYAQDQKHVYFFAAPSDEEPSRIRIRVAPAGQRNTKIIFVKAPSQGPLIPEIIAPPSQAEDKTLVYVLVKKPSQLGDVSIPTQLGVKQAKPEVYFIKYNTKEEAEQAVSEGLNLHAVGSNAESLIDARSFVNTIRDNQGDLRGSQDGSQSTIINTNANNNYLPPSTALNGPY